MAISLALACQSVLAQAMYRITPLGYLDGCNTTSPSAGALNDKNEVVGAACNAHHDSHAFLWKDDGTGMVDLGPSELGSSSSALFINASGLVAGWAQDSGPKFAFLSTGDGTPMIRIYDTFGGINISPWALNNQGQLTGYATTAAEAAQHAFVWKNDGSPLLDLGTLGGTNAAGASINDLGQVVGYSDLPGNATFHAFIWRNDGTRMRDLGSPFGWSSASFINSSGQIAGSFETADGHHAFFMKTDSSPMHDLGALGGTNTDISGLNDAGQIAGTSSTSLTVTTNYDAFLWKNDGTRLKDLGALTDPGKSSAHDINSFGQSVGASFFNPVVLQHAVLWRNDGTKIQDLNTLIDPTDPLKPYVTLTFAHLINNSGNVVADGIDSRTGRQAVYLLKGTVLTLTPRSLPFGNRPINTSGTAKSVTMKNTSPRAVTITSIALTGTAAGQFASTDNCGKSLAGRTMCTIEVTFKPTTKGLKSAVLNVNGGGGGLLSVKVTGKGT